MDLIPLDKEIQKKVYDDLFWPSLKEAWKALWNITGLVTTISLPIQLLNHYANWIFRNNIDKFDKKLKNIPEENIIEVTPDIWVPILEKLTYIQNEKISDLFLELLKKASNKDEISLVHPKYAKIIENLSEDEALILEYIYKNNIFRFPFINLKFVDKKSSIFWEKIKDFTALEDKVKLNFSQNINSYLKNLESLWIIENWAWKYIPDEWENKPYNFLINHQIVKNLEKIIDLEIQNIEHEKWFFEISQLWKDFLKSIYKNNIN